MEASMKTVAELLEPQDKNEEEVYAIEKLVGNMQAEIMEAMEVSGVTKSDLAERMGINKSRVSHLLGDKARNITLATVARVFFALGQEAQVVRVGLRPHDVAKRMTYFDSKCRSANENWPVDASEIETPPNKSKIFKLENFRGARVSHGRWNNGTIDKCA